MNHTEETCLAYLRNSERTGAIGARGRGEKEKPGTEEHRAGFRVKEIA